MAATATDPAPRAGLRRPHGDRGTGRCARLPLPLRRRLSGTCDGIDIVRIKISDPTSAAYGTHAAAGRQCHDNNVLHVADVDLAMCAGGDGLSVLKFDPALNPAAPGGIERPTLICSQSVTGVTPRHTRARSRTTASYPSSGGSRAAAPSQRARQTSRILGTARCSSGRGARSTQGFAGAAAAADGPGELHLAQLQCRADLQGPFAVSAATRWASRCSTSRSGRHAAVRLRRPGPAGPGHGRAATGRPTAQRQAVRVRHPSRPASIWDARRRPMRTGARTLTGDLRTRRPSSASSSRTSGCDDRRSPRRWPAPADKRRLHRGRAFSCADTESGVESCVAPSRTARRSDTSTSGTRVQGHGERHGRQRRQQGRSPTDLQRGLPAARGGQRPGHAVADYGRAGHVRCVLPASPGVDVPHHGERHLDRRRRLAVGR